MTKLKIAFLLFFASSTTALAFILYIMPFVMFGDCSLKLSQSCTVEEKLANLDKWKQIVVEFHNEKAK